MSQVNNLTVGKPSKILFRFYIPLLCTSTLQQLYNVVDSMIVGKGIGDNALAAVGTMGSLTFLTIGACNGLYLLFQERKSRIGSADGFQLICAKR